MKTINRAQLRGEPLGPLCGCARTTRHVFGPKDNRVFCFGISPAGNPEYVHEQCQHCKALVDNAEPMEEV